MYLTIESDLDGDGYPDLVVGEHSNRLQIFFNNFNSGSPGFHSPVQVDVSNCQNIHRHILDDFNGDGCIDMMLMCKDDNEIRLMINPCGNDARDASNWNEQTIAEDSTNYDTPVAVKSADFNNDGRADFVFCMEDASADGCVVAFVQVRTDIEMRKKSVKMPTQPNPTQPNPSNSILNPPTTLPDYYATS